MVSHLPRKLTLFWPLSIPGSKCRSGVSYLTSANHPPILGLGLFGSQPFVQCLNAQMSLYVNTETESELPNTLGQYCAQLM